MYLTSEKARGRSIKNSAKVIEQRTKDCRDHIARAIKKATSKGEQEIGMYVTPRVKEIADAEVVQLEKLGYTCTWGDPVMDKEGNVEKYDLQISW